MRQFNQWKSFIIKNWIFYAVGALAVVGMKYFYSRAGSDDLKWILAPTSRWVRILTGISFEYEPDVGYINYSCRFIIAASCSGLQFMVIALATLIYSFVHRMKTIRHGFYWMGLSMGLSYLFTILVNGLRIVVSIYLPLYLRGTDLYGGWLTPERLHTVIGIGVYFTSLLLLYLMADNLSHMISCMAAGEISDSISGMASGGTSGGAPDSGSPFEGGSRPSARIIRRCIPPVFWYFSIILGIPLITKAYENNIKKYMEYAFLMAVVCLTVTILYVLACIMRKHRGRTQDS